MDRAVHGGRGRERRGGRRDAGGPAHRQPAHSEARAACSPRETRLGDAEARRGGAAERAMLLARAGLPAARIAGWRSCADAAGVRRGPGATRGRAAGRRDGGAPAAETPGTRCGARAAARHGGGRAVRKPRRRGPGETARPEVAAAGGALRAARERTDVEDALAQLRDAEAALRGSANATKTPWRDGCSASTSSARRETATDRRCFTAPGGCSPGSRADATAWSCRRRCRRSSGRSIRRPARGARWTSCRAGRGCSCCWPVRIAFIETMEVGCAPPAGARRGAGNSDDHRARGGDRRGDRAGPRRTPGRFSSPRGRMRRSGGWRGWAAGRARLVDLPRRAGSRGSDLAETRGSRGSWTFPATGGDAAPGRGARPRPDGSRNVRCRALRCPLST